MVADIEFKDVIPISIGVNVRDKNNQRLMSTIITKNTSFPCSNTKTYSARKDKSVKILIL